MEETKENTTPVDSQDTIEIPVPPPPLKKPKRVPTEKQLEALRKGREFCLAKKQKLNQPTSEPTQEPPKVKNRTRKTIKKEQEESDGWLTPY